ncbi:hypothetical protein ACHAWF_013703 [Thalassiosira exigua]
MTKNTVKFNVGGRNFEVSRDLIERHSDTMLGRLVSDAWQEDPEETVFICRDGDLFAHVLNFLRYGSIELPASHPKSMFDRELDFYGLVPEDEAIIHKSIAEVAASLHNEYAHAKIKRDVFCLATEVYHQFVSSYASSDNGVQVNIRQDQHGEFYDILRANKHGDLKRFSHYLGTHFGLKHGKFNHNNFSGVGNSYYWMQVETKK